jgi:hypothetical protein
MPRQPAACFHLQEYLATTVYTQKETTSDSRKLWCFIPSGPAAIII